MATKARRREEGEKKKCRVKKRIFGGLYDDGRDKLLVPTLKEFEIRDARKSGASARSVGSEYYRLLSRYKDIDGYREWLDGGPTPPGIHVARRRDVLAAQASWGHAVCHDRKGRKWSGRHVYANTLRHAGFPVAFIEGFMLWLHGWNGVDTWLIIPTWAEWLRQELMARRLLTAAGLAGYTTTKRWKATFRRNPGLRNALKAAINAARRRENAAQTEAWKLAFASQWRDPKRMPAELEADVRKLLADGWSMARIAREKPLTIATTHRIAHRDPDEAMTSPYLREIAGNFLKVAAAANHHNALTRVRKRHREAGDLHGLWKKARAAGCVEALSAFIDAGITELTDRNAGVWDGSHKRSGVLASGLFRRNRSRSFTRPQVNGRAEPDNRE